VFSGVFIAEEVEGAGDKESEGTMVDVQTLFEAFLNMSKRSARLIHEAFPGKKQNLHTLLKCQTIRVSKSLNVRLKEFWCTMYRRIKNKVHIFMFINMLKRSNHGDYGGGSKK
jgi:hypothetical protein